MRGVSINRAAGEMKAEQPKIYHVKIPNKEENWAAKNIKLLQNNFEELPLAGKIVIGGAGGVMLGAAAVVLAPIEFGIGAVAAGAAAGGALMGAIIGVAADPVENGITNISNDDEKKEYENKYKVDLQNGHYYVTHPKRPDYLIPAQNYYDYIINEQAADLVTMIKSAVPAKEILIQINVDQPVQFEILNSKSGNSFGFKKEKSTTLQVHIEAGGSILDDGREVVWDDFIPVVQSALKNKDLKSFTFHHKNRIALGINAMLLNNIGLSINLAKEQHYGISVRC